MSNVLLVNCPSRTSEPPRYYPYGLAILCAVLSQKGHSVDVFDGNFIDLSILSNFLLNRHYEFVGLSGLVTTYNYQKVAAQLIRRNAKNSVIASGGGLASATKGELLDLIPELDVVFINEAEVSLPSFLSSFSPVPGIAYRKAGAISTLPSMQLLDNLDQIPYPALGAWSIPDYFAKGSFPLTPTLESARRRASVLTSRGCEFQCDFCSNSLGSRRIRFRTVENVVEEIRELIRCYNVDYISFLDELFSLDTARVLQLAESFRSNGWTFRWGVADRSTNSDIMTLRTMRDAGCDYIYYGFDSGSPETLLRMNKRLSPEDNVQAFMNAVDAGIYPVPNLIIGYDNETMTNIDDNYKFLNKLIQQGKTLKNQRSKDIFERGFRNFGAIYFATPYPGSRLYERNKERLPHLPDILRRISSKDAYELTVNVSSIPDDELLLQQRRMESFVRSFRL